MSNSLYRRGARALSVRSGLARSCSCFEPLEPRQLMAADPVTPDNPLWLALPGVAVVDGVLTDPNWSDAFAITRAAPFAPYNSMSMKLMYDGNGLYIGLDVKDTQLWSDGRPTLGGTLGLGFRWEVETDDSLTLYFDADNSRDEFFQSTDRALAVNLGSQADFESHAGSDLRVSPFTQPLALAKYIKGNGTVTAAPDVTPGGALPAGVQWVTVLHGTVNNNADVDEGWTTEMFIPWDGIGLSGLPANGQTIGMNFDLIFDQQGGPRDLTDNRSGDDRFTTPAFVDDQLQGVQSSYDATRAGLHGPVNYAVLMFLNPSVGTAPAAIAGAAAANVTGYSAFLNFTAPAPVPGQVGGGVSAYEVRYSSSAITTDAQWLGATVFENTYTPRLAGLAESLRVIGLTPATTYHVAVRARDAAGNLGALSNDITFTTKTTVQDVSGGLRLVPSPSGRTLVTEGGATFVAVGDHLGLPWEYTRNLYPGSVWDSQTAQMVNFNTPTNVALTAAFFDALAASGVNTMRVYLELQNVYFPPTLPDGTLWLEGANGTFNDNMRVFMLNVLKEASRVGVYVIFSPFDTFSYDEVFQSEFPWSSNNGGPLTDINNFFQETTFVVAGVPDTGTLGLAERRMKKVIDWVNTPAFAPYVNRLLGWEPMSEWDSYEWTLNAEGNAEPGRETEFRRRAQWIEALGAYIKSYDPTRLLLNSTISQDPRGPEARQLFYSRTYDLLTPHLYTSPNDEPMNNPDADRSIDAAEWNANLTYYWLTHVTDRRPVLNGEWGIDRTRFPGGTPAYGPDYTQAEDEYLYRAMIWSGVAAGQFGTSLRIATDELSFNGYILTDAMRSAQKTLGRFFTDTGIALDGLRFNYSPLLTRVRATSAAGHSLKAWGSASGSQGVVYVLQDGNATTGNVSDGVLTVSGLRADSIFDVEVWSTAAGVTGPLATISGVFAGDGSFTVNLPAFAQDVAVKFKARPDGGQRQRIVSIATATGDIVTFYLDLGGQPVARILNSTTNVVTTQDVSGIASFTGRIVDMTPFLAFSGVSLAATDVNHHVWLFSGDIATGTWTASDLTDLVITAAIPGAAGITGDLTTYQPSWGAVHIAGLDSRGHAVNYWFAPGSTTTWQYSDLTALFNGPVMSGGLTGYVAYWDGLNLAGLNSAGEVIVYWWAPGLSAWQTINMTTTFSGPTISGQLDAYTTPWGALNIAGRDSGGSVVVYWWAPALGSTAPWRVSNLTDAAGASPIAAAVEVSVAPVTGVTYVLATDSAGHLQQLSWSPLDLMWRKTDATATAFGKTVEFPLGSAAGTKRLVIAGRNNSSTRSLIIYTYLVDSGVWQTTDTGVPVEI